DAREGWEALEKWHYSVECSGELSVHFGQVNGVSAEATEKRTTLLCRRRAGCMLVETHALLESGKMGRRVTGRNPRYAFRIEQESEPPSAWLLTKVVQDNLQEAEQFMRLRYNAFFSAPYTYFEWRLADLFDSGAFVIKDAMMFDGRMVVSC